jgi:hypothetical protein
MRVPTCKLVIILEQQEKQASTYMLIHILGDVGYVKVGVTVIGKLLELRVERFLAVSMIVK